MKINKKLTRPSALICIFALVLSVFSACGVKTSEKTYSSDEISVSAKIYTEEDGKADEIFALITDAVKDTKLQLSSVDENAEIYKLNRDKIIYASDSFKETFSDAIMVCTALFDRVDISIGKITSLWGFGTENPRVPDSAELANAVADKSLDKVFVDTDSNKITIPPEIEIDMSALGDGIACDNAYEATRLTDVPYIMTVGNTVMAYARHPRDDSWTVDIANPFSDSAEAFAEVSLEINIPSRTVFLSSSGGFRNMFEENGKTYHSTLNPKTGLPVESELLWVTVVASSGLNANALSNAVFVNGFTESSLAYLENFGAEAVFVFKDKTYYVTEGLKESFRLSDSSFTEHTEKPATEGVLQ